VSDLYSRSIFVAVEGIDGTGKTTQVEMLARALRAVGLDPILSREPTNGLWGQRIRDSAANGRLSLEEELHAFINDRREHVQGTIQPALDEGKIVILDRYFYSTIAYQGSRGADVLALQADMEAMFPIPDRVFLLDLDPTLAIHRISHSRKEAPNEFERVESLIRARDVFNSLGGPITRIDGSLSIPAVHQSVMRAFVEGPLRMKRCAKEYGCDDPVHCSFALSGTCEWWNLAARLLSQSEGGTVP
jgi:dTMP kinase